MNRIIFSYTSVIFNLKMEMIFFLEFAFLCLNKL